TFSTKLAVGINTIFFPFTGSPAKSSNNLATELNDEVKNNLFIYDNNCCYWTNRIREARAASSRQREAIRNFQN
ncbi:hypothetical protein HMPREF9078_02112, partial [Capnocytophaga sp. oral taxon 380 str. F0488]